MDRNGGDRKGSGGAAIIIVIVAVLLIALTWLLLQLVRLALSRSREYLADAGSVELTKNPDAMISALRKIEGRGELPRATSAVMELCVDNPREGFSNPFATHPSVQQRVQALVKFAGGHDPRTTGAARTAARSVGHAADPARWTNPIVHAFRSIVGPLGPTWKRRGPPRARTVRAPLERSAGPMGQPLDFAPNTPAKPFALTTSAGIILKIRSLKN